MTRYLGFIVLLVSVFSAASAGLQDPPGFDAPEVGATIQRQKSVSPGVPCAAGMLGQKRPRDKVASGEGAGPGAKYACMPLAQRETIGAPRTVYVNSHVKNIVTMPTSHTPAEDGKKIQALMQADHRQLCCDATRGDPTAQVVLGNYYAQREYERTGNMERALKLYRGAADQGHAGGQFCLGCLYEHGKGTKQDYGKAAKAYRSAAKSGHPGAQNNLGTLYERGAGVQLSLPKALKHYHAAAEQDNGYSFSNLGRLYYLGKGVPQSDVLAFDHYEKAAEHGLPDGQYWLGKLYQQGRGCRRNANEAASWYHRAALQGHVLAQFYLAKMYECGKGVQVNYPFAIEWYERAARFGHAESQNSLALLQLRTLRSAAVIPHALGWLRHAARQGHQMALFNLGYLYERGLGIARNTDNAVAYYLAAARNTKALQFAAYRHLVRALQQYFKCDTQTNAAVSASRLQDYDQALTRVCDALGDAQIAETIQKFADFSTQAAHHNRQLANLGAFLEMLHHQRKHMIEIAVLLKQPGFMINCIAPDTNALVRRPEGGLHFTHLVRYDGAFYYCLGIGSQAPFAALLDLEKANLDARFKAAQLELRLLDYTDKTRNDDLGRLLVKHFPEAPVDQCPEQETPAGNLRINRCLEKLQSVYSTVALARQQVLASVAETAVRNKIFINANRTWVLQPSV